MWKDNELPKKEESMTEEEGFQDCKSGLVGPKGFMDPTIEILCREFWFERGRRREASRQKMREEMEALQKRLEIAIDGYGKVAEKVERLEAELAFSRKELSTLKFTIITTIKGTDYEGNPTSEINFLQRLRILLEKEAELARLRGESPDAGEKSLRRKINGKIMDSD